MARRTDVAQEAGVLAAFGDVERNGGVDILVSSAGILIEKPLLETTADDFDSLMAVEPAWSFPLRREAIRQMVRQGRGGRVINIASELAYLGREGCSVYCASKGGVLSLTRSWAREFAPAILVNAIAPAPRTRPCSGPARRRPKRLRRKP